MTEHIAKGYALGLSSHSSMQNPSEMFKKSEIFEISSISKNEDPECNSKDNLLSEILPLNCRFCGRGSERENIVTVCQCQYKFSGHISCVNNQTDAKCKRCGSR